MIDVPTLVSTVTEELERAGAATGRPGAWSIEAVELDASAAIAPSADGSMSVNLADGLATLRVRWRPPEPGSNIVPVIGAPPRSSFVHDEAQPDEE